MDFLFLLIELRYYEETRKKTIKMNFLFASVVPSVIRSVGRGGALVESIAFNRRVVGSTPALAVT